MDPSDHHDDTPQPHQPIERSAVELRVDAGMSWPAEMEGDASISGKAARRAFDEASLAFTKYNSICASIDADRRLTPEGKRAAREQWAQEHLPALVQRLVSVREDIAHSETKTVRKLAEHALGRPEEPADIAVAQAIWGLLRAMPDTERTDTVERMIRDGDTAAMRAIMAAPGYLTGVTDEDKTFLCEEVVRRDNPQRYAHIQGLRKGLKATERALEGVVRHLTHDPAAGAPLQPRVPA